MLLRRYAFLTRKSSVHCQRLRFVSTQSIPKERTPVVHTVTTPIFYANADPHLGHLYSTVLADALRRWYQLCGKSVRLSTGTDEHGLKIQQAAAARSCSPKEHCDALATRFQSLFDKANVGYDRFVRTTDPDHRLAVEALWTRLEQRGYIYRGFHEGWYSVSDEAFYPENQIREELSHEGTPIKVSVETGKEVEWVKEENYMFKLSEFREPIETWLTENNVLYPSSRTNQVLAWLHEESQFQDLSVSRPRKRQSWGIPVPGDPSQTVYVWLDALTNYMTVTGFPSRWNFTNLQEHSSFGFPATTHIIGKDILRFHAIYWPAFLMAAGLPLPKQIVAHGHWTVDHVKMSKSLGNVVDPVEILDRYGADAVRYFLLRDGSLAQDGDYSEEFLRMRYQIELVNQLGNLLSRCLSDALHKEDGKEFSMKLDESDRQTLDHLARLPARMAEHYDNADFLRGLHHLTRVVAETNQYIASHAPWKLVKSSETIDRARTVVQVCLEALRVVGILLQPVIPDTAQSLLDRLNIPVDERLFHHAQCVECRDRKPKAGKFILLPRLK